MKIITSNSSRGAYRGVLNELRRTLDESNVVLAPDRFTASVERGLISSLELSGSFNIEVMSFTRLANRLIGRDIKKCLTPEGSVMLIRRVIDKNLNNLNFYGRVAKSDGFENEIYAAITAFRNSGVDARLLESKLPDMPSKLRRKTEDLILIFKGYLEMLEQNYSDSSTRLNALADFIKQRPESIANVNFYSTDIYDFSAPELKILKEISNSAKSLTIGVVSGYNNENRRVYPDYLIKKLSSLTPDKVTIVDKQEELSPETDMISKNLFACYLPPARVENRGKIEIVKAKSRAEETTRLALEIKRHVMAGGRYKDFEVFVSDIADFETEIKSTFLRYDIPFFIDKKELLSEQTLTRYITQAIAAATSGLKRREVLDFVKNPLFFGDDVDENCAFEFENYVLKYGVDRNGFLSEFEAFEQKRDFMHAKSDDKVDVMPENVVPERVRKRLLKELAPLSKKKQTPSEFKTACLSLLEGVKARWQAHVLKVATLSEYYQKSAEQVEDKLVQSLDEIETVLEGEYSLEEFENMFGAMLKKLKIALVPTFLDCVFVGDAESRYMGSGNVYIMGATSDKFPSQAGSGNVITQSDEEEFGIVGVDLTPNARRRALMNMYFVLDLMKKPRGKLTLSYSESGDRYASTVIEELKGMFEENGEPIAERAIELDEIGCELDAVRFSTKSSCMFEVLKGEKAVTPSNAEVLGSAYGCLDEKQKRRVDSLDGSVERINVAKRQNMTVSVSRLESFFTCPYAYYFNYVLSLKKRKDSEPEGFENGIMIHDVLEKFFAAVRDGNIDEEHIAELVRREFDDALERNGYVRLLKKPAMARSFARLKEEGVKVCKDLYEIFKRSSFTPKYIEAELGKDIDSLIINMDGKKLKFNGKIDRVDVLDNKFLVIDYKTYKSADFSLKELYYGKKLQLYIYMRSVESALGLEPVGVFYLPIYVSFNDEGASRYNFKGKVTNDMDTLKKIDSYAGEEGKRSVLPIRTTKDGLSPETHLDRAHFDMLGDYAQNLAFEGARLIDDGYIKPAPLGDACSRCDFSGVCRHKTECARKAQSMKMADFERACGMTSEKEENCDF